MKQGTETTEHFLEKALNFEILGTYAQTELGHGMLVVFVIQSRPKKPHRGKTCFLHICKNKGTDQLHCNCAADQRLCFRYIDNTLSLLPKSEISSLFPSSVAVQPGLCGIWLETPKTGFLTSLLITKTSPCNEHPLTPHFYIVKLGCTGVYIFLIFAPKHRLWALVRTASLRRF